MDNSKLSKTMENKLSMFIDVENVLNSNSGAFSNIGEFMNSVNEFKETIEAIREKAVKKKTILAGKTIAKSMKRIELENVVSEIASGLYAFGSKTGNEVLKALSKSSQKMLERIRDNEIPNKARALLDTVEEHRNELTAFGIGEDDIARLRNLIDAYVARKNEKSLSANQSVMINKTLSELLSDGMNILEDEIDMMVNTLRSKERNLYNSYYAVRSIRNAGIRHKKEKQKEKQTEKPEVKA